MSADDGTDPVRAALADTAESIELPKLLPLSAVAPSAVRRSRRRQVVGGLVTILLVAVVTMGVGIARQSNTPSSVFAGQTAEQPLVPSVAIAEGDRFIGLAIIDPFEENKLSNMRSILVMSVDGVEWEPVPEAPTIVVTAALMGHHNGVFHIVGTRGVKVAELDGTTSVARDLVHLTSSDLVEWSESIHAFAHEVESAESQTTPVDMAFVDTGPIVLLSMTPSVNSVFAELEALGYGEVELCDFVGEVNRTRVRVCGETEPISIPRSSGSFSFSYELVTPSASGLVYLKVPRIDDGRTRLDSPTELYQTDDGVGITSRVVFESADGIEWEQIGVGREPAVLMAARGNERLFKTSVGVPRYRTDDPLTGMGYSSDQGENWTRLSIGDIFVGDEVGTRLYGEVNATPGGWILAARRRLVEAPPTDGVDVQASEEEDSFDFTVTVDGHVLAGRAPYGTAELRNPDGDVVRSWAHLEVANPLWSGISIVNGDKIVESTDGATSITVTAEQWSALVEPLGPNRSELLFSSDGLEWSTLDSSAAWTRVLATTANGVLVQRWPIGDYSEVVAPVELIPFPAP